MLQRDVLHGTFLFCNGLVSSINEHQVFLHEECIWDVCTPERYKPYISRLSTEYAIEFFKYKMSHTLGDSEFGICGWRSGVKEAGRRDRNRTVCYSFFPAFSTSFNFRVFKVTWNTERKWSTSPPISLLTWCLERLHNLTLHPILPRFVISGHVFHSIFSSAV
jgi:hypothetical protein